MARDFNGTTDRIDYTVAVDAEALGALSIAFWIIRDAGSAASEYVLNFEASGAVKHLIWFDATERLGMILQGTTGIERYSDAVPADGALENWCFTWSGGLLATSIQIFRNGNETGYLGPATGTGTLAATTSIHLGGRTADDLRNFDGKLSEVAMWSRALSAAEVAVMYNNRLSAAFFNGLNFYAPIIDNADDQLGGAVATLDGTTVVAHPPSI